MSIYIYTHIFNEYIYSDSIDTQDYVQPELGTEIEV